MIRIHSLALITALGISPVALAVTPTAKEFLDGNKTKFSTAGHPKAKGVNMSLYYPRSWVAQEGERPNIVQKFVGKGQDALAIALIHISSPPFPAGTSISPSELEEILTPDNLKDMLPDGATLISAKSTKIDGLPAGILEYSQRLENAGMTLKGQSISYIFVVGTTMIQFQCSVLSAPTSSSHALASRMDEFKPLFFLMANSIVLADQWTSNDAATTADSRWKQYPIAESGFTVALPSEPQSRVLPYPAGEGSFRVYQATENVPQPSQYSIFVGLPEDRGIYEPASMDAYLRSYIKSQLANTKNSKLQLSRQIKFRDQPALEYKFSHQIDGQPYIARGVAFMIDGGHMRLSMQHSASDSRADTNFKRFVDSFQLTPIAYLAADRSFVDQRGVGFSPPKGWIEKPAQNSVQAARFTNLTRSMLLLVGGNPAYRCSNVQSELQATGRLLSYSAVRLSGQQFTKLTTFEDVPKLQVRLTDVYYCIDSRLGAVVLSGAEEESMFSRWAQVFEGAAASIRVR